MIVHWEWQEEAEEGLTWEEQVLLCIAEANELYRKGTPPLSDREYDYLCAQVNLLGITDSVGTALNVNKIWNILGYKEDMLKIPKRTEPSKKQPAPENFGDIINDYSSYRKQEYGGLPMPSAIPYMQHRIATYRCWDVEYRRMDYGVLVTADKILIPAKDGEDITTWEPLETSSIEGVMYFTMKLDEYFILMEYASTADKEGTPLYENDIVRSSDDIDYYVVWDRFNLRWVLSKKPTAEWTPATLSISINYAKVTKKIGDIFDVSK
jgi:hypothetical protein